MLRANAMQCIPLRPLKLSVRKPVFQIRIRMDPGFFAYPDPDFKNPDPDPDEI